MSLEYVTVYQISKQYPDWLFRFGQFVPLIIAVGLVVSKWRLGWRKFTWFHCVFFCFFALIASSLISNSDTNSKAFEIYQKGIYSVVEGNVTDFHPMPYEGHEDECFSVQKERFCYSDYMITPGFHNSASHGGPIRAGLPVRIAYSGSIILRLDIAAGQVLTSAAASAALELGKRQAQTRAASNPIMQRMNTAFLFTAVCLTLWWNLQWKRVMRFWLRPPFRPATQGFFRIFFALNLLGAITELVRQLHSHPLTRITVGPTLLTTIIMCLVVSLMSSLVLWRAERRDRQRDLSGR